MAQPDILKQLKSRFETPLDGLSKRRIVFWHDADGSFEAAFDELYAEAFSGSRNLHFAKIADGGFFALKREIYRQFPDDDYLIYTRAPKDLSAHGLEGNWFADLEFVSEHFQADFASMLMDDLGAVDSAAEGVELFRDFFKAADRREKFKRLMPAAQTKADVALGVIGALLRSEDLSVETLVRTYLCALEKGREPLRSLGEYGADTAFASFIGKRLGYVGDLESLDDLAAHLLLTALSIQLPDNALDGLENRISAPHGQFCLNIVHAWMAEDSCAADLYDICRRIEALCNLEQRFSQMPASALMDADVLPCINERILIDLCSSMGQGADRSEESSIALQRRKGLRWFGRVADYFDALGCAVSAQRFYRRHMGGFHYAKSDEVWKAYVSDWYRMDTSYRHFCRAFDSCQKTTSDLPIELDEAMEILASWMERIYVNWFLTDSNACWVNASEKSWEQVGYVEGVARQRRFFDESVLAGSSDVKKTMVIVSDALRFEVAAELSERLERDTRGLAELKSMQCVFPSITEFGMAALLPHTSMSYSWNDGGVYVNGNMPTTGTEARESVLRFTKPNSRCIQSKDLIAAKRTMRKELVGNAEFVYVYHNKIDSIGEEYSTEHMVFEACDNAMDDIVTLVKIATGDLNFSRVIITADHGFLYTRDPLEERDKVSKKDIAASTVKLGRRYAISDDIHLDDTLLIKMNMDDVEGGSYTGLAPRECIRIKKAGPGENYVHGGVSLQECCVPVIQFRNKKAGSKGYEERIPAELRLLSTQRRITSMLFKVELYQPACVGGKILPAEYELVMTDALGNEVSDVLRAHADMTNTDEKARVSNIRFSLKADTSYDAKKPYYLLCRSKENAQIVWKEKFTIDIAFVPLDDFGF